MRTLGHIHARHEANDLARDAARYRWLRERDLDTITTGGVFAGMTPANIVLNGCDLDKAIDAAMLKPPNAV
jgi:hypothetical protein